MKNIEDFLTHPEFIRWVRQPDKELEAYWDQWRKANPEQLPSMRLAKEILLRTKFDQPEPLVGMREEVLQQVLREREKSTPSASTIASKKKHSWTSFFWDGLGQMSRVAAILVASIGLVWLFAPVSQVEIEPQIVQLEENLIKKVTGPGEKLQFTLADGSRVWLNSSSEVEFPEKFGKEQRLISLKGEAYFEVERDSLRPFKVNTEGLVTTVLGTSFNVNARDAGKTRVALVSGKVKVSSAHQQVALAPGEMLNFDEATATLDVSGFDPAKLLGWKEGVLQFHKASLREVKEGLEEWYGVEILLKNGEGVRWQFSGEYRQQTLEEVLESMSYIQGFNYKINDKSVNLTF
ncbi:FecR family protein [Pleomorphovibrio marinus]|uniref:FecR family protein n=1 Tax=Pleomorphovibrio marinus TaxID=2164132 RepID=UPI001E29540E|nr:FecR domain-containing protein [Pleomorphovibrio marinus]